MVPNFASLVKEYGGKLKGAGIPKAHQEAVYILNQILGQSPIAEPKHIEAIGGVVQLRERRMPLERIFGITDFSGVSLRLNKDVFKPCPETADVIRHAISSLPENKKDLRILDLGTGTGCILLALLRELPEATGIGIDVNETALEIAQENARLNGLLNRADFRQGNWTDGLTETFDIVISNPPRTPTEDIPYLPPETRDYDPIPALDGGHDGLSFIRKMAEDFERISKEDSLCVCQIGPVQASRALLIFQDKGFRHMEIKGNDIGAPCCLVVNRKASDGAASQGKSRLWNKMVNFIKTSS